MITLFISPLRESDYKSEKSMSLSMSLSITRDFIVVFLICAIKNIFHK